MIVAFATICTVSIASAQLPDPIRKDADAIVEALRVKDYEGIAARFDDERVHGMSREQLAGGLRRAFAPLGPMKTCAEPKGRITAKGTTQVEVVCDFGSTGQEIQLGWSGAGRLIGLYIVPTAATVEPAPVEPDSVAVTVGATGWPLPGTLRLPVRTDRPVPVAVFVHGSGPADRDESHGPNKVFRDLADGLAARGIASLRYDKRTRAQARRFVTELEASFTLDDESVDDAVAALAFVAARKDVGPIFVVGHSEGAWLAPRIAARATKQGIPVAGVVMLAGNLTPLADLLVDQYAFLAALPVPRTNQAGIDDAKRRRDDVRRLIARGSAVPDEPLPHDAPASYWLDAGSYDPAKALLDQPALPALLTFGERDYQVPIREKALWETRLAGRPNTTIVAFPGLNHLLMTGEGPMTPVEYDTPGHVAPALIDRVSRWIDARVHPGA